MQRPRPSCLTPAMLMFGGLLAFLWMAGTAHSERPALTPNVPVWEFQNKGQAGGYDFNAPPKGFFHSIQFSEDFEQEIGFHRTHEMVPVNPTDEFATDSPVVYLVFKLHQHYEPFQIIGLCYPEDVDGLEPADMVAKDAMVIQLEDDSGYLQFFAPSDGWKPGRYKVEIHVGWEVNEISLMGTMRFSVRS